MAASPDKSKFRFIFDVGGVLIRHDDALLCDRVATLCAKPVKARSRLPEILQDRRIGTGETDADALHRQLVAAFGFRGDYQKFLELWSSHFAEMTEMIPVLDRLSRDHRVVLFSNTNEAHWSYLTERCQVLGYAQSKYLSYRMGLVKPDAASFQHVLEREGGRAEECFFVDDKPDNVAAARAAGMIAHAFTGADEFADALSNYGIRVRG